MRNSRAEMRGREEAHQGPVHLARPFSFSSSSFEHPAPPTPLTPFPLLPPLLPQFLHAIDVIANVRTEPCGNIRRINVEIPTLSVSDMKRLKATDKVCAKGWGRVRAPNHSLYRSDQGRQGSDRRPRRSRVS